MKTDRFSDIIRRKLESIRPEFSEKDWAKMQSTLQNANMPNPGSSGAGQPFAGSIWSSHPWMMAAATISTVALVTLGIWQRREINELRQTVGQLNKQQVQSTQKPADQKLPDDTRPDLTKAYGLRPKDADESSTPSRKIDRQSIRPDTVYINRYVAVPSPSRSRPEVPNEAPSKQRIAAPTQDRYAKTSEKPASTDELRQSTNQPSTTQTAPYGVTSTSDKILNNKPLVTRNEATNQPENERVIADRNVSGRKGESQGLDHLNEKGQTGERLNEKNQIAGNLNEKSQGTARSNGTNQLSERIDGKNRETKSTTSNPANAIDKTNNEVGQATSVQPEVSAEKSTVSASYELANSRPLLTKSLNWNSLLAQRAKRMQPARPVPVTIAPVQVAEKTKVSAPESQPINRGAVRFRAGVGGEIASSIWSAGVFTETLIGKHLTVGVGLSKATYAGTFIDDFDFDVKTRRDFRKEYGLGRMIDPKRDILNIDTKTARVQIPLSLGYRIPVTQTLSLLPTIGTSLNLKSAEEVTFYCPIYIPVRSYDQFQLSDNNRTAPLINTLALGVGLEWQRRHWVVQTSPVLTLPMQSESDPNWQNSATLGLRARVLFQF